MALFSNQGGDRPKKPSFFQRVRQAVTGESAAAAEPERQAATAAAASAIEEIAPQNSVELAELEGTAMPAAAATTPEVAAELAAPADAVVARELPELAAHDGRNEFGLRPMTTSFSFGGYADDTYDEGFVERMRTAVARSAEQLNSSLNQVLALGRRVDEETLEELEAVLLTADIGMTTTHEILGNLRRRALQENADTGQLRQMLREELLRILDEVEQPTNHPAKGPEVILMVGVNGTGKTTTSGKLAALYGTHGRRALLCAADTFRAAAIEQLDVWAQRSGVEIVKTKQGGDPSAALYDALSAAKARQADIVIVDTAGRLHNKAGLMAELDKMRRTAGKLVQGAPHQTFLVIDATTGQNGMQQARLFTESAGVSGIVLTKLDGTAKGGIVVAIARELRLPVVFVGTGEKMADIIPFDAGAFVDSLLGTA